MILDNQFSNQRSPTQRAADLGYAPRYLDICLASSFSRFSGESTLPPQAANASRWAVLPEAKVNKCWMLLHLLYS
jgi:hypothetical protein